MKPKLGVGYGFPFSPLLEVLPCPFILFKVCVQLEFCLSEPGLHPANGLLPPDLYR